MRASQIRPIAICLFTWGQRILVSEGYDSTKQSYFCRPLGGGIEFGESSRAAVLREIDEELGVAVENLRLVGVLENIFTCEGQPGHEIVFIYDAELVDQTPYERLEIDVVPDVEDPPPRAVWKSLAEMEADNFRLVPDGLAEMLAER